MQQQKPDRKQSIQALARITEIAGSQMNVCRALELPQSTVWTWQRTGVSPTHIDRLVALSGGEITADEIRPDVFGWLAPLGKLLNSGLPPDALRAAIDLLWHQIEPDSAQAVPHLRRRGWSSQAAHKAISRLEQRGAV